MWRIDRLCMVAMTAVVLGGIGGVLTAHDVLAQTEEGSGQQTTGPQFPPPPPPKLSVATEKPIEGEVPVNDQPSSPQVAVPAPTATGVPAQPTPETSQPAGAQSPQSGTAVRGTRLMEELSLFNVPTDNLRTMKLVIDDRYNLRSLVYGDELGYLHILTADEAGNFLETWKSPPLNNSVRGVFVEDLEGDGETEITAYTSDGNIFIYGYESHTLEYRTPQNTYNDIRCMVIADVDNSPEKELLFIAVMGGERGGAAEPGYLIQFDPVSQFEEWRSQERYAATDMILGNVDRDEGIEIVLNSGEILDTRFKDIKWKSDQPFGSRLYLIDLDSDGILELVTSYNQSSVRIFDIDQRREKW